MEKEETQFLDRKAEKVNLVRLVFKEIMEEMGTMVIKA